MRQKIETMLTMQAEINDHIEPEWLTKCDFPLAIMVESVEAVDSTPWKWWKHGELDALNLKIELVDIWHFAMSMYMVQEGRNIGKVTELINLHTIARLNESFVFDGHLLRVAELTLTQKLRFMVGMASVGRFSLNLFTSIMEDVELSWEELYRVYIGKNVLNKFRQDNGYKDGSYVKKWAGREDNFHMLEIVNKLDVDSDSFNADIYDNLKKRYYGINA
jgi:hypothetical protein